MAEKLGGDLRWIVDSPSSPPPVIVPSMFHPYFPIASSEVWKSAMTSPLGPDGVPPLVFYGWPIISLLEGTKCSPGSPELDGMRPMQRLRLCFNWINQVNKWVNSCQVIQLMTVSVASLFLCCYHSFELVIACVHVCLSCYHQLHCMYIKAVYSAALQLTSV